MHCGVCVCVCVCVGGGGGGGGDVYRRISIRESFTKVGRIVLRNILFCTRAV